MVTVYDMRSGELIEQSAPAPVEAPAPRRLALEPQRITAALQLVEPWSEPPRTQLPPVMLMGCYFDETGE